MKRRRLLAALAGTGLAGGSLWAAQNGIPGVDTEAALPRRVETLSAAGSEAGEATVPTPDTVTLVDLFATWCDPCDEQIEILGAIRPDYDDVSFVSVTNERPSETLTRAEIADWWDRNGGRWTVGIDPGSDLLTAFGADGLPYVAIADADGTISYRQSGLAGESELREQLDRLV